MKFEKHIQITNTGKTAVDVLGESTVLTRQLIKKAMSKGSVWVTRKEGTKRIRRADRVLLPGDSLHIYYDDKILELQPQDATLITDENQYSIWFKPCGILSQGSVWGDHCTINRWVEKNLLPQRPAFMVHRLDRAATGLMIIAHQKKIAVYFSKLFQLRQIEKQYQAVVHGQFPEYVKLDSKISEKQALSHCRIIKYDAAVNQSLVGVSIETGRKHQIRRHLSEAGFPIVGDRLYGNEMDNYDKDLCLTSCYLSFISPVDNTKKIYILPDELLSGF